MDIWLLINQILTIGMLVSGILGFERLSGFCALLFSPSAILYFLVLALFY